MAPYQPRLVDPLLGHLVETFPAVFITGARAVGKTTTALRHAASTLRLDEPREAESVSADPDAVLQALDEPVLIDEWQRVPEVLGAVKRAVDQDSRPGRFIITGSSRARHSPAVWPGTGRLINLSMFGMTVGELSGHRCETSFLDRTIAGALVRPGRELGLRDYVDLALRSGFPDAAIQGDAADRRRWLTTYATNAVSRDASELADRDPVRLLRYLQAYALSSAGTPQDRTIYEAAGVDKRTGRAYERLLVDLFVAGLVPAWMTNRLKRLVVAHKRYLLDTGLMAALIGADAETVIRDGELLGRVLDTFVVAQLRPEIEVDGGFPRMHHLRLQDARHEIDLVVELGGGRVVAIEIKAGGASRHDARHLAWLRDQLGDRFVAGVVLHTGAHVYSLGERIAAAPIATIWS